MSTAIDSGIGRGTACGGRLGFSESFGPKFRASAAARAAVESGALVIDQVCPILLGSIRGRFVTLLMALLKGSLLRGSISPRVPLILTPTYYGEFHQLAAEVFLHHLLCEHAHQVSLCFPWSCRVRPEAMTPEPLAAEPLNHKAQIRSFLSETTPSSRCRRRRMKRFDHGPRLAVRV